MMQKKRVKRERGFSRVMDWDHYFWGERKLDTGKFRL
jgi:hypothetical protein